VRFDVYAGRTGANFTISIHDSGGTTSTVTPVIALANTWQTVLWDTSGITDANKDAINQIKVTIINADADDTFYIDNFRGGGSVTLDTSVKEFGIGSGVYDGIVGYLTAADSADWYFGTGDFTLEGWFRFSDITGIQYFFSQYADSDNCWYAYKDASHKLGLYFRSAGATKADYIMTSAWTPSINQWYHLEFVRYGTFVYIFINGVSQVLSPNTSILTNDVGNVVSVLSIGARADGNGIMKGRIDEVRFSKGLARNTANFTPQTSAYTIYGGVFKVVTGLGHLEGRDVSILADGNVIPDQEVSGSTITLGNPTTLVHAGLGYNSDLETLNVELGLPDGTLQGRKVQISRVVLRLDNSRGGYLGPDFDHLYELLGDYKISVTTSLYTGDVRVPLGGGYSDGGRFCFRQSDPLPITILAVLPLVSAGGTTGL
jgi:hypothetical protein